MNGNRADALLQWVNSLSGSHVLSIKDFAKDENFEILVTVVQLIDKDCNKVIRNGTRTVQDRIICVLDYLQGIYQDVDKFITSHLLVKGNELEFGKLISLLLCAAVQGNNVSYFVEKIHNLDNKVQSHLKAIIETMLYSTEKGEMNGKALAKLLQETDNPGESCEHCHAQSPLCSPSVASSPAEMVFSNSPFMTLMLSPQMKNKQNQFMANKLHKQVKKLQMDLNLQHHLQSTLEDELAEKNRDIDAKSTKIRELQKELVEIKMAVDELESYQHFKSDYEKAEKEVNKLKEKIVDLEDYKVQYSHLEERTEKFLKEKELFDKQVEDNKIVKERLDRYKRQAHQFEFQVSELEAALHRREEEIQTIIKQRDEAVSETTELWRSRTVSDPVADEEFQPLKESLLMTETIKPNQESRLIELEFENERLKKQLASAIDPSKFQQLNERLEDVERSKKSYEEKYVNAKSTILSLEDNLAHLEGQSRIRQEALQRKIDDTVNLFNDTKNKLEQSRKEVSRLQSEVMISRGEVEAHVIALEKQRVTTRKAMDDMAAERKVYEEESSEKLNELRRELEFKEKQALENCEKMSKEYDVKLRNTAEELKSIHTKDRQDLQSKLNEVIKEKENLRTQFIAKENELQQAVKNTEQQTFELRDVYENLLADMKRELENEVKKSEEISQKFKQTGESLEGKISQLETEKCTLNEKAKQANDSIDELNKEITRLNGELEHQLQDNKILKDNESTMKIELEELKTNGEQLKVKIDMLNKDVASLSDKEANLLKEKSQLEEAIAEEKDKAVLLNEEHQFELSTLQLQHTNELESLIDKMERSNKQDMDKMKTTYDELARTAEETKQQLMNLSEEKEKLVTQQQQKDKCIEAMKDELTKTRQEKDEEVKSLQEELSKKSQDFEAKLSALQTENDDNLKKVDSEMAKLLATAKQEIGALKDKSNNEMRQKDEQHDQQIAQLNKNNELEIKRLENEAREKHDITQEEIAKLKTEHEETMKRLKEEQNQLYETSKRETSSRDRSLQELTDSFTKLKQETDATEARLLDITRERNELEKALTSETKTANEKIETMSFQNEQMKAEHSKAVQEMLATMQEERKNHKKEQADMKVQLDKACVGLKVAADNIEEFKNTINELEQNIATKKSTVIALEAELEHVKDEYKDKQRKMYDDASKKSDSLQQAFEADRNTWKKKLNEALEENMAVRSEMFEKSQKHSAEMMEIRRLAQVNEDKAAMEEKKLREEIRQFIANLANERVNNNELKEKLQQAQDKFGKEVMAKDDALHDLEEKLKQMESKESELIQTLDQKDQLFNEKCQEIENKERTMQESLSNLEQTFEAEKTLMSEQIQEKEKESSELHQIIESLKKQLEEMTKHFTMEKESSKEEFQKELQVHCSAQEKQAKEINNLKKEIDDLKDQNSKEIKANKTEAEEKQEKYNLEIEQLEMKLKECITPIKVLEDELKAVTEERDKMVHELKNAEETWTHKETELNAKVCELEDECKILKEKEQAVVRDEEEIQSLTEHMEKLEQENSELEEALQEEKVISRRLGAQINSLSAQVNHADRTIREQKQALENMTNECENARKGRKQILIPVDKVNQLLDADSSTDDELLSRDDLKTGPSSTSLSSGETSLSATSLNSFSRSSLRSTIGGRAACNRRQSAIYLKRSTPPDKRTTAREAFFVLGDQFNDHLDALEEPFDAGYDWQRLEELERRNTICQPHMKTSYPIETQTRPEDNKNKTLMSSISDSGYRTGVKRNSDDIAGNTTKEGKLRKDQPNSKSEGFLKRSKSKKLTETVSSKLNSLRSRSKENLCKEAQEKSGNSSVAFSIDITPPNKKSKTNETSLKEPKSTSKSSLKKSMAFTIDNSPPKTKKSSELKPKRQRTITRSTASTRLVLEKDKEVCKEAKKKQYLTKSNRKPLRNTNKK